MQLLELIGQRTIAIQDRNRKYTFTVRQITERDWQKYFDGIDSRSKRLGNEVKSISDADTPMLKLIDEVLLSATGYALPAGVEDITKVENWKQQLKTGHRMKLGQVLLDVEAVDDPLEDPEALGIERVVLRSTWRSDDSGRLVSFSPLIHRFKTPDFDQYRRYKRDQSQTRVVGGSRTGETIYPGWQRTLIGLYDELIIAVEGYSINGNAIGSQGEAQTHMDTYHKVVAMQEVFRAPQAAEEVEELEAQ